MNSEQNQPEASMPAGPPPAGQDNGSQAAPGEGTSRSSRRRRRRRKNKGPGTSEAGSQNAAPVEGQVIIQSGEDSDFAPRPPQQNNGPQQGQNSPSAKRWKKKQRRRERDRSAGPREYNPGNQAEPGNSAYGNSGGGFGRRNKKPKGPRSFVGPMDHSYREVNGNYADSPPSTMEMNGNRGGGHNKPQRRHNYDFDGNNIDRLPPELRAPISNVTIREDAPTHIYFFVDDLFIAAKVNEASRKLGVKVAFLKNDPEQLAQIYTAESHNKPALIVFDLNNANAKPLTLIPKIRTKLKRTVSIIGFLSVLQGDLKAKATEAGCDTVMPKAAFSQNLPNLLRRYGAEDEEEQNFNQ